MKGGNNSCTIAVGSMKQESLPTHIFLSDPFKKLFIVS